MNLNSKFYDKSIEDYDSLIKYLKQIEDHLEILKAENSKIIDTNKKLKKKNYLQKQFTKSVLSEKKKLENHKKILNSHLYLINDKIEKAMSEEIISENLRNFDNFWEIILKKNEEILNLDINKTLLEKKTIDYKKCENCDYYKSLLEKFEMNLKEEYIKIKKNFSNLSEENKNWQIKYENLEKKNIEKEFNLETPFENLRNRNNQQNPIFKNKSFHKRIDFLKAKSENDLKKSVSKSQEIKRKQNLNLNFKREEKKLDNLTKLIHI